MERDNKRAEVEARGGRGRWRGGGAQGAWGATPASDGGKAALRELARRGILEREEVKAMLRPGPLQDFRGSVLQVGFGHIALYCSSMGMFALCLLPFLRPAIGSNCCTLVLLCTYL